MDEAIKTWQHRVKAEGCWEGDAMKLEIDDLRVCVAELRAALAQQGEPVAWINLDHLAEMTAESKKDDSCWTMTVYTKNNTNGKAALYLHPAPREPMTDADIEKLRDKTFSINNPFCPVDSKSFRKSVRAAEWHHGIKEKS